MQSIYEFVKAARDNYRTETIEIIEGYEYNQYETLRTIELYHNSRFTSGQTDDLGREKPFYNIGKFRVNVATRATDLDTKDVKIDADRTGQRAYIASFLLSLKNRNWMKQSNLSGFLNKLGHTRSKYGGVLVKKTERDGELGIHVMRWRDLITDQVHILSGPIIERHYYTPAELKEMDGTWENIDEAIRTAENSRTASATDEGKDNQTPGDYIEVYEVHGVLSSSYLDEDNSEDEYQLQMHVVVLDESKETETKGVTLFSGIEDECPYKYLPWEEVDGRALGVGTIEDLFEAQVWTNYSVKQKKDMLDLAGKIIFQTADTNIAAKNVLTDLEVGSVITHGAQGGLTQVNSFPSSLPSFSELIEEWNVQAERVTSTFNSITGETMPSGTPFRQVAILNQEAGSIFEYRREEAGLFLQEIYQDWVLPFLQKQIRNEKELMADLEREEIEMLSTSLGKYEANNFAKEQLLDGKLVRLEEVQALGGAVKDANIQAGNRRSFTWPDDFFEDTHMRVDVITTGEQKNKAVVLETLFNVFQVVAQAPQVLDDPRLARIFNQIVETAGVSPLMLQSDQQSAAQSGQLPEQIAPNQQAV